VTSAIDWNNWPIDGWTTDDLDAMPEDGMRRELVDGVLLVSPAPARIHQIVTRRLANELEGACPARYGVVDGAEVRISKRRSLIPDVLVATIESIHDDTPQLGPEDVVLAVEVVSPGSKTMDRVTKPNLYAAAGIPCYWRVELDGGLRIHTHQLDGQAYLETGAHRERLVIAEPWPIDLVLDKLLPRTMPRQR
jgi:Uma2 family endonuclease